MSTQTSIILELLEYVSLEEKQIALEILKKGKANLKKIQERALAEAKAVIEHKEQIKRVCY